MDEKMQEITDLVETLAAAYPAIEVSTKTLETYLGYLSKFELVDLRLAVDSLIETSRLFPSISEIREEVKKHKEDRLRAKANEEFKQSLEEAKANRYIPTKEEMQQFKSMLRRAVINVDATEK